MNKIKKFRELQVIMCVNCDLHYQFDTWQAMTVECKCIAQDKDRWQAIVNVVMNLQVP